MMQSAPISRAAATQEVLSDQRVHRRHPGDVDDREARAALGDLLEEALSITT